MGNMKKSKRKVKLEEIASIERIKLGDVRCNDLIIGQKFDEAWGWKISDSKDRSVYIYSIFDFYPQELSSINISIAMHPSKPKKNIFKLNGENWAKDENKSPLIQLRWEHNDKEEDIAKKYFNEEFGSYSYDLLQILNRDVSVIRIKKDCKLLSFYILQEIKNYLPKLLEDSRPPHREHPSSIPLPWEAPKPWLLLKCPVQSISIEDQISSLLEEGKENHDIQKIISFHEQYVPFIDEFMDALDEIPIDGDKLIELKTPNVSPNLISNAISSLKKLSFF